MKSIETNRIIREIASQHGISFNEVKRALEAAISQGLSCGDPDVQEKWSCICPEGSDPEIGAVLIRLALVTIIKGGLSRTRERSRSASEPESAQ